MVSEIDGVHMKHAYLKGSALFAAGFLVASAAPAASLLGPKGSFSSLFYSLEYDPGRACSKPSKPFSGSSEFAWSLYRSEATRYLDCIKAAATSDVDYAAEVVRDGYKKAVDDFIAELRRNY